MSSDLSGELSKSGIVTSATGERHIPSSVRADGSVRKEIRVRAGYRPPEDVEVYKNRAAEAFKNRGTAGIPGATFVAPETAPNKNSKPSKKSDARKAQIQQSANTAKSTQLPGAGAEQLGYDKEELLDPEAEKEKEAKKLAKKLRQARDLEQKRAKGDNLLPEQLEKVIRINELTRQLNNLGFDNEGQKKT